VTDRLEFHVVDVFTDVPFAGNQLAVVLGGQALTSVQMQTLARQFQLSETAFPLDPTDAERARGVDYRLRIFTPSSELPFAGHPSVGTAWLLARLGRVQPGTVTQVCLAGDLPLVVAPNGGAVELTGGRPTASGAVDPAPALAAIGLAAADLVPDAPVSRIAGTGLEYLYLPVRPEALTRCGPDLQALARLDDPAKDPIGVYAFTWDAATRTARARMFGSDMPTGEDPATGSAALGLGVWLVASGWLPGDGTTAYSVRQGVEMGRPSQLECSVDAVAGSVTVARVSGRAAAVAQGWTEIPPA
jgi:trans-2,3-dihydro-3-hydroxyanthranilate isomerase